MAVMKAPPNKGNYSHSLAGDLIKEHKQARTGEICMLRKLYKIYNVGR